MLLNVSILLTLIQSYVCIDFTFHIEEGKSSGTYVGDIAADTHLLDTLPSQDYSKVTFTVLTESGNIQLFNVSTTGKLYTAHTLDAEAFCAYNVECFKIVEIAVEHDQSLFKILEIKVVIKDINDNYPVFQSNSFEIQFFETDVKGFTKTIPNAIDRDVSVQNSNITYQLKKNMDEPFKLIVSKKIHGTDKIRIGIEGKLDREIKDNYKLQVIARDGGSPPKEATLNVQISVSDDNDNPPVFSQNIYNVSIKDTHQKDIPVAVLSATDLDSGTNGNISYHFSSKTINVDKKYFNLNEKSGEIFLKKNFLFGKIYKLFIEARDGGNPPMFSTVTVFINAINQQNNAPNIHVKFVLKSTGNTAIISEDIKVGSFVAYVKVTDNDIGQDGEVTCDLVNDKLQLQSLGEKKYQVVVKSSVDRETGSSFDFTINCQDKGSPPLKSDRKFSIKVTDINDVIPQFSKDTFMFLTYENEETNFPVGYINATDQDLGPGGEMTYSLLGNTKDVLPFQISKFGFISTTQSLDHEQQDIYKFKVLVKDNGTPSLSNTANVIVEVMDRNDNAPYFTFPSVDPFRLDVHYHPQSKNDITVLRASDRDSQQNAFLKYDILGDNDKQLFTVNSHSGIVSFSRPVYQNDAGSYDLQFVVKDSGTPVLSATTTLSLTLTVSNKTSKMFTAVDTEQSDNKIHFNLVIIIVIAAVIVSVAIVVSIAICIVQRQNQRNVYYSSGVDVSHKSGDQNTQSKYFFDQNSTHPGIQYTIQRNLMKTGPIKYTGQPHSGYMSGHRWEDLSSGINLQDITEQNHQIVIPREEISGVGNPDHLCDMSTLSSHADSGHGWSVGSTGHYEELPDLYPYQPEHTWNREDILAQTLSRPKETNTTTGCSYQPNGDQNTPCNGVLDIRSLTANSASPNITSQPSIPSMWNNFTSTPKSLPPVAKVPTIPRVPIVPSK